MNYYDEDDMSTEDDVQREKPDIATTIEALRANDPLDSTIFYGLSDLTPDEIAQLTPVWDALDVGFRRKLILQIIEVSESNFEFDYSAFSRLAMTDPDAEVRAGAVEALWEDDSVELMDRLIEMAQWDDARDVRATATTALGRFVLAGELGEFPEPEFLRVQDVVINILNNEDEEVEVRRRALESIANSSHEIVEGAIRDAYESHEHLMQVSAVFAMGRSCDEQWAETVMHELDSADPEIRYEAARAAGELMLEDAVAALSRMSFENDRELQDNAIWSLGEIGSREAIRVLNTLAANARESDDEDLLEAIEDALANATVGGSDLYMMHSEN